jgi:hypothetical protein
MQFTFATAAAILAFCAGAIADQCASGSSNEGGNWYCQPVKGIQYSNVGGSGSYNKVTSMGGGACGSQPLAYTGPLAPFDEEVSLHFRGPLQLKQFAAYTTGSSSKKREVYHPRDRRHAHEQFHKRKAEEKRADIVTAVIDGKTATWENNYFGAGGAATTPTPVPVAAPVAGASKVSAPKAVISTVAKGASAGGGAYSRKSYYNAEASTADGVTFLGYYGGAGSGVFDTNYGSSLSYISADASAGASSSTCLANTLIPSNKEFVMMTADQCSGNDCGFVRPGSVAYHGWDGADKVFLFEFSMPSDGSSSFNGDMPAIWLLNAQIPRTLQYGEASCSCWTTGCGEFDIVEVLSSGSNKMKSTIHGNKAGGSSDYILRPTGSTMKLAAVFSSDGTISVNVLPDSTEFPSSLSAADVSGFINIASGSELSTFVVA